MWRHCNGCLQIWKNSCEYGKFVAAREFDSHEAAFLFTELPQKRGEEENEVLFAYQRSKRE